MDDKMNFALVLSEGTSLFMTECETYGMAYGCDIDCPVLRSGNCELKDCVNKGLWEDAMKEMVTKLKGQ